MIRAAAFLSSVITISALAQIQYATIGHSQKLRINSNGSLGINLVDLKPANFLDGSPSLSYLAQAGLWITATDQNDLKHTSVQYLSGIDSFDFYPGPIDKITGQTGIFSEWNKVWQISQDQIDDHKKNWSKSSYILPIELETWPANGTENFNTYLAPFVDVNGNNIYDPKNGDYPAIKGEETTYVIFNDLASEHNASLGLDIGVEIQLLAYTLPNQEAIFLEYYVIQRKNTEYKEIKVGFFISGECGNKFDNYAGTFQENTNAIFIYNGDNLDEGYFESNLPYTAAIFLENNMATSIAFDGSVAKNGVPIVASDFANYAEGMWKDGTPLTYGNNGTGQGSNATYIYPQSDNSDWTEESAQQTPGQRSIVGVLAGRSFTKNDYIRLRIALISGNEATNDLKGKLKKQISSTKNAFIATTDIIKPNKNKVNIRIYPNPIRSTFVIENAGDYEITLSDFAGTLIDIEKKIKINDIWCNIYASPGIYTLRIKTPEQLIVKKICIQH